MNKKPWEKRLKDLSYLLSACSKTYFDPEMFRLNLNQFLQTSRTVTFIIQKNKKEIKDYELWYPQNVVEKWSTDPIMIWAKDSRNVIEKQGDLDMFSEAKATLIYSYFEDQDIEISTSTKLLGIGVKQLVRLAQKILPSGITDGAVVKSERRWVANSLEEYELLYALTIIYGRVYECCESLGLLIKNPIDVDIISPKHFDSIRDKTRHVTYFRMKDYTTGRVSFNTIHSNSVIIPESIKEKINKIDRKDSINSIVDLVESISKIAEINFLNDGYHIQTLFLFNKDYQVLDLLSTNFQDQAEKYVFWRVAADRAKIINAYGFVWISELWIRNPKLHIHEAIHKMPIIGEKLQIIGVDAKNNQKSLVWNIVRESEQSKPFLNKITADEHDQSSSYFMLPILKAIGGDISMFKI